MSDKEQELHNSYLWHNKPMEYGEWCYLKGRADTVNELSAIKNFCDDCYMEFCEGCKHNGEYAFEIQKKLEQLKKSQERYEYGMQ